MPYLDIFSRIELPKEEVFKCLSSSHNIPRYSSPFFKLENISSKNPVIDLDTSFSQKCVFLELLQLFFRVKEITPNKKILFRFDGLIKGTQSINLIDDENSCIIKERLEFSLYNQFNLPLLAFVLSMFFYTDIFIKHVRLKNVLYKDYGFEKRDILKEYSTIRSYIVIDANIKSINSLFEDLNKFSIWLSHFFKIEPLTQEQGFKEGNEFTLEFILPFLPLFQCKIDKKEPNKITISFSSPVLKGNNIWSILPCENELIVENAIEINYISVYLKLLWPILANTLIRSELNNWNERLKEIAEKTNLSKFVELSLNQA